MSDNIINQNPWWNKDFGLDVLPIGNDEFDIIKNKLGNQSSLVIQGAPGIGKTFMMKRIIQEIIHNLHIQPHRIIYLNCEQSIEYDYVLNLIESNSPYRSYLFLDNIEHISSELNKILSKHSSLLKIICSTIKSSESINKIFEENTEVIEMQPCDFNDYIVAITKIIPPKCKFDLLEEIDYSKEIEMFLMFGGYPAVIFQNDIQTKMEILKESSNKLLNIYDDNISEAFRYLSMQMGKMLNICELADKIGRSRYKTDKDISSIEEMKIVSFLPSFETNIKKALVKSYKIFFHDLGYRNSLINSFNNLNFRQDKLELYLNFTALCLAHAGYTNDMSFFRTTNQTEINFIIETNQGIIPTQIAIGKSQKNIPRIFKSFIKQCDKKIYCMLVVTEDLLKEEKIDNTKVLFIPAHTLSSWNGEF